ncbi:FAD-binding PCMH-type domain-containing protein [Favolaschia claudopus]|uniref:FAD-binding PCMH-type domain-containing protein n=1 Tax=Favolaschia claudopus TaxID=2862362 RepID=A0AAW0AZK4_9AGAR
MATIAGLSGNQFLPSSKDYSEWQWQYATSTHEVDHDMNPGLIVQPHTKEDIKKVILYAKAHDKAIAIRTGGHQYSGASSTGPNNIQLDLRSTFRAPADLVYVEKGTRSFVRASVSHSLGEFNAYLGKHHVFVPHGQCTQVHVGGHAQTGGYGQLGRSFGLFGDYIRTLEIIDHNGEEKEITRASDPELFYAWLGGSPGNLGVLTHFLLEVNRDSDYVGSLGLRAVHLYDTAKLRKLLGHLAEMSDDENFPRNYDLCISVLSASFDILGLLGGLDEKMKEEHPEIFGHDGNPVWPRMIVVYAQYVPFTPADKPDMNFFEQLKTGCFFQSEVEKKPMSQLTSQWIFRNTREFDLPYVKRTYVTKSKTLVKDGWVDWVVGRMDEIVEPSTNGQWLSAQLQCFGGKNSMFTRNANNGTSYSWRDSTMCMTIDNFHKPEKKAEAEAWEAKNDAEAIGPQGIFSKEDRRVLWGSYGSFDLDSVWETYYEDRPKYERLMRARKMADPNGTFTPNTFCVKRAE